MEQNNIGTVLRQSVRDILQRAQAKNQAGVRIMRARSMTVDDQPFTGLEKVAVWLNAEPVDGKDSRLWRKDPCGALMYWGDYADSASQYGWEVDHINPVALGGTDAIGNLQALHWKNNRHKGDTIDQNYCEVGTVSLVEPL
ncbi:MAG TPA: HNH endonuclease signature motif containing protein [Candidatus Saccharimonadales bacterium]|nr:HNH endonuclease signature motif containing protein [Candidatus Saccharimonadales bacterium]